MAEVGGIDLAEVGRAVEDLFPEALRVWVHGSVAGGTARPDSDLDIAILGREPIRLGWDELDRGMAAAMAALVEFRDGVAFDHREPDAQETYAIIAHRLDDLLAFSGAMLRADPSP
jgi:predicted nucleotidyltransferase